MPKLILRKHACLFTLLFAAACVPAGNDDTHEMAVEKTSIRAMHLSPDAPNVDILANGDESARLFSNIAFGRTSKYVEVAPGEATLDVVPAGGSFVQRVLHVGPVELEASKQYTAVAFDRLSTIRAMLLEDDPGTTLGAGYIRVRVIHAASGVGKVDVWSLPSSGSPALIYDNVSFGDAGPYLDLPLGAYELGIDLDDDAHPELTFPLPEFAAGTIANVFAVSNNIGAVSLIAQVQAGATLEIEPKDEMPPQPTDPTHFRAIHLSPDAPAVNIYANGRPAAAVSALAFGIGTSYLEIPSGNYRFDISPDSGTIANSILRAENIELRAFSNYTAVALGDAANLRLLALEDLLDHVPAGKIRVRAIHAAFGVGTVDIWNVPDRGAPSMLVDNLDFGVATDYLEIPAGAYSLGLDADGDARPDFIFDVPGLAEGTVANIFAVRDSSGAVYLLAQLADSQIVKIEARDLTPARVRIVHLSPDAPNVAVFANQVPTPVVDDLAFRSGTPYVEVPNGSYSFDIAPARSPVESSVLRVDNVALAPEHAYTAAAIGSLSSLSVLALEDDYSNLAPGMIRVRAIHAAVGVGRVNIQNVPSAGSPSTIFAALDFGVATDYLDLPAGEYRLGIDVNNDHHPELLFSLPALAAGTVANVFASADMHSNVELVAQLNDGTIARIASN